MLKNELQQPLNELTFHLHFHYVTHDITYLVSLSLQKLHLYCHKFICNRPFYSFALSYLAMNASDAGVDLALIQISLLFSCKCNLISIRTT